MILLNLTQGTPEWVAARVGVISASMAAKALDTLKSGAPSAVAVDYCARIAHEILCGESCDTTFVNDAMRRGTNLEGDGRMEYEARTGRVVLESGFAMSDCRRFGYSTDGLVESDGLIEIKCPASPTKVQAMWATGDVSEYVHQIQMGLWITERRWCDFVMYDPRLAAIGRDLYVKRIERDEAFIEKMVKGLYAVRDRVDERVRMMREAECFI